MLYANSKIKSPHFTLLKLSSSIKITIFNMVNGVRINKNYDLCSVNDETPTPSGTEVLVVTTWQIKAKR